MEQAARLIANPRPDREPAPSRRSLLSFFASTAAVAAVAATPAVAAPVVREHLELLAIGDQLSAMLEAYRGALRRRAEAVEAFESLCPPIPPDLVIRPSSPQCRWSIHDGITRENVNFLTLKRIDDKRIYDAKGLKIHIIQHDVPSTTKEGRRLRRLARMAMQFEKARDAALQSCGYLDAEEACSDAVYDLEKLAIEAARAPLPRTRHGVEILARVTTAIAEIADEFGNGITITNKAAALGRRLAEATLSIGTAAAA